LSKNKTFIGVSETYDFIVTIPEDGKIEYYYGRMVQVRLRLFLRQNFSSTSCRPDKIGMMQKMAKMDMKMELMH
jgi:hypothetical protein